MRCETSLFSMTLLRKQLTRNWPMWAVWLAVWLLAMPVSLWNAAKWVAVSQRVDSYPEMLNAMVWILCAAAPLVAILVYFHLFKSAATNFIGALPLRREGVFLTAWLAGYIMLVVPLAAVAVVTFFVEWALGTVNVVALLQWLGGCMLLSFFWFNFATLCCVISGNGIAAGCFYLIFNGVVLVMSQLIAAVLSGFLYGFDEFGPTVMKVVEYLTPAVALSQMMGWQSGPQFALFWKYAAVGFLMLLAALGLHHIRRAERSGDLIVFGPVRWLFRISVTVCGGLSFGLLLFALVFSNYDLSADGLKLALCCAAAAMVSWFAAEMLLAKSFKVFHNHWRGAAVSAVAFILAICAIDMDWIGFSTRVPQAHQVQSAQAEFYGGVDPVARDGLEYDPETVQALIDLQQYLVDHRDSAELDSGTEYGSVDLRYDMGLMSFSRRYHFNFNWDSQLGSLMGKALESGRVDVDTDLGVPTTGYVSWRERGVGDEDRYMSRDLTTDETARLWAAVKEDVEAGRYHAQGSGETNENTVEFGWRQANRSVAYRMFYLRESCTATQKVLQDLALLTPQEEGYEGVGTEMVG